MRYRGKLDVVRKEFIQGWAFEENSDTPLWLQCLVDNTLIGEFIADIPVRSLTGNGVGIVWRCGFRYVFPEKLELMAIRN